MSLRDKAAQVLLVGFSGTVASSLPPELLDVGPPGGVLLLGRNVQSADQLRRLIAGLQEAAAADGRGIGLLVAVDQEGGPVARIGNGVTPVPAARTLGERSTPAEAGELAAQTAKELLALGVNVNLAPVADVVSDPSSFLYRRSYSGDTEQVAAYVAAVVAGYEDNGLAAVPKHFPGHGAARGDTHQGAAVAEASRGEFESTHLPPFIAGFDAGAEAVMVAHIIADAYDSEHPASSSSAIIEDLLRGELGFDGLVITDDIEMAAADETGPEANSGATAVACLRAGSDLIITLATLSSQEEIVTAIVSAVGDGSLSEERLDEAVLRILEFKQRKGLHPFD